MKIASLRSLICAVAFIASPTLYASYIPLAWDASISPSVAGYIVYYGVASGSYTNSIDVGNVTNTIVNGLSEDTTYFFAVKSYDGATNLSDFSSEIQITVYPTATLSPSSSVSGQFARNSFDISGETNYLYVVQASTNLMNWVSIQTNISPFTFTDTNADSFNLRFFRTVNVSNPTNF